MILVIPCFNEEKRLPVESFKNFSRIHPSVKFLFVNDGSEDGTLTLLRSLSSWAPSVFSVEDLPENVGKAEAVRRGFLKAFESTSDFVGFWDADLATPLEDSLEFLKKAEGQPDIQMVFGSRVKLLGRNIYRRPVRHYLGRVFATIVSLLLGLPIYDSQCGSKLFRMTPELKSVFEKPFLSRWIFDIEIIARSLRLCREKGMSRVDSLIYEYPLEYWKDIDGSKVKPADFFWSLVDLCRIYWAYLI